MENNELRAELLKGMCEAAEKISRYYFSGEKFTGISFYDSEVPEAFKPGVADKFMFNKILDSTLETIKRDLNNKDSFLSELSGVQILSRFYYPQYGIWRKGDRKRGCID